MSATEAPAAAICPVCPPMPEGPVAPRVKVDKDGTTAMHLSLPTIHCAACISAVERGLLRVDGVAEVRVNLTRKRAVVRALPNVSADTLVAAAAALGYEAQVLDGATLSAANSDRAARDLAMRLGVAGFSMMNVMLLSVAVWSGAADATRDLFHWLSAAIALPTVAFSAQPFFKSGWSALRVARLNMDVPISLAILLAALMSLYETLMSGSHAYFDAALSLTFFLLAGRYLDQKMRSTARSAAAELAALEVPTALRMTGDVAETVPVKEVAVGDILLVQPGARVPVDGTVTEGATEIDRAFLTGETDPVAIATGNPVHAGEVNLTGVIRMSATAVGEDTFLHGLSDLIANAEAAKSRYNSLADRAAQIYAPLVHLLALLAFGGWLWVTGGDVRFALNIAVAVLIITCPCALGLAVPAVSTVASGRLYRSGILVKHPSALERLAEVDEVILDKTGTLTRGVPTLAGANDLPAHPLALAAAVASGSAHPRSRAIVAAAGERGLVLPKVTDLQEVPGFGVEGKFDGRRVRLGRAAWAAGATGDTGTVLAVDGAAPVAFAFEDTLRPGAQAMIDSFRARGLSVTLLSGDTEAAVSRLAGDLGIASYRAAMLPDEKAGFVADRTKAGAKVLMVGDGLNDTAALAGAHVSMAPGSALEAARVAADLVLLSSDLSRVGTALITAVSARRRILENFAVAAIYNMIAVPIALLGFATPLAAAIAMSTSSIIVSVNALRTR